jgi:hypothetical protein
MLEVASARSSHATDSDQLSPIDQLYQILGFHFTKERLESTYRLVVAYEDSSPHSLSTSYCSAHYLDLLLHRTLSF